MQQAGPLDLSSVAAMETFQSSTIGSKTLQIQPEKAGFLLRLTFDAKSNNAMRISSRSASMHCENSINDTHAQCPCALFHDLDYSWSRLMMQLSHVTIVKKFANYFWTLLAC